MGVIVCCPLLRPRATREAARGEREVCVSTVILFRGTINSEWQSVNAPLFIEPLLGWLSKSKLRAAAQGRAGFDLKLSEGGFRRYTGNNYCWLVSEPMRNSHLLRAHSLETQPKAEPRAAFCSLTSIIVWLQLGYLARLVPRCQALDSRRALAKGNGSTRSRHASMMW